jgi:hypothetical protein
VFGNSTYISKSIQQGGIDVTGKIEKPSSEHNASPLLGKPVDLDAWVREIIAWHFDPDLGTPYWLERARELDFDPRQEIQTFDDLERFGPFPEEDLRRRSVWDFVPRAYLNRDDLYDLKVMESGGTTGLPKRAIGLNFNANFNVPWNSAVLDAHGFGRGEDWLLLMPTGPHCVGLYISEDIKYRQGLCHRIDFDPRWVKRCVLSGNFKMAQEYTEHVLDQTFAILETQDIAYAMVTSRLLESMAERVDLKELHLKGILCAGTHLTPETNQRLREALMPETMLVCAYGNTLMLTMAPEMPPQPGDSWDLEYYPHHPYAVLDVRRFDRPWERADYGEWGRVGLTTLMKDFFLPNFLERDEAVRIGPHPLCPWDGIANVRPWTGIQDIAEGLY